MKGKLKRRKDQNGSDRKQMKVQPIIIVASTPEEYHYYYDE